MPNPVQSLGLEQLTDQKDADGAVPAAAYHDVTLTHLDGSGLLSGDYARVASSTGSLAQSATNVFRYTRSQDEFEQVMAYYWVTQAQQYIHSLGFGETRRPIDNGPQAVRIDQLGQDNSFATDHPKNELRFGKGGVDDAEDAEVILHEYGHAIHFSQGFSFASEDAGAISDCLRRVDTDLHYPADVNGEVHHDGQIWSRALWDIRQALGHVKADTLILQGSFDFPGTSMPDLAARTVAAAQALYGTATAKVVRQAFVARGILA